MSSVFTATVDLSKVKKFPPYKYHILVDSSKMSVFIEFIELVRSMFNITAHIRFVSKSGYIHYLEDIRILSVIQEVQAEVYEPEEDEKERMELITKTLNFYDESQNIPKILLARLRVNFDDNTGEIVDGSQAGNLENKTSNKYNETEERNVTSRIQRLAIESKQLSPKKSDQINGDKANSRIPKHLNICEVDYVIGEENKKSTPQPKPSINQNRKRCYDQKPFSLGAMVSQLRASTSKDFPEEETVNDSHENINLSSVSSAVENEMDDDKEEETVEDSVSKKRKRVRKHRSRKGKKLDEVSQAQQNFAAPPNGIPNGSPSVNVPFKNKHVRFGNDNLNESSVMESDELNEEESFTEPERLPLTKTKQDCSNKVFDNVNEVSDDLFRSKWMKTEPEEVQESKKAEKKEVLGDKSLDRMFKFSDKVYVSNGKTNYVVGSKGADELMGLLSYKKNNQSPVAYKRFDGNGATNGVQPAGSSAE